MVFTLSPKEEKFFTLMQEAANNIGEGARVLHGLLTDWDDVPGKVSRIKEIEDKGDDITHDIIKLLNSTFVTPLDREDILAMASRLDDVIDRVDAAAARLVIFRIERPTEHARALVRVLCLACEQISQALVHFQKRRFLAVTTACVEINRLENEGDSALRLALEDLFDGATEPLEVLKWKEIYETLEEAIDRCEDVSNVLETVALKNA